MADYSRYTNAELEYIISDADAARECARDLENQASERKYGQQAFDATYELEIRKIKGIVK